MVGKLSVSLLVALLAAMASAQWSVIDLHPPGAVRSQATGVGDGQQVGWANIEDQNKAIRWTGSAASWLSLSPAGQHTTYANGVSGGQQSGFYDGHAAVWNGTAGTMVDLNPAGSSSSYAFAVEAGVQGGYARVGNVYQASLWSGTAASWQSLHPVGATVSEIYGMGDGQQVGYANFFGILQASLWSGSAGSRVSLHPAGATESAAYDVDNGTQTGYATMLGVQRAGIWKGNIGSWVSMHPAGVTASIARAIDGDFQSGWVRIAGVNKAGVWSGTPQSWWNLHSFLPAEFTTFSESYGISFDGEKLYVAGTAVSNLDANYHAIMWVSRILVPEYERVRGIETGGNQQSLESSDDDRLTFRPGIVFSTQQAPVEIRFDGTAPTNPNGLAFSIESSASFGNAQQAILLWNFQTGAYETLDTRNVTLEDDAYRVTVTTNPSRFIEAGTRAMRAAVTVRAVGPSFAYPWTYRIDKAWWNLPG
jgi:hypothetical protein